MSVTTHDPIEMVAGETWQIDALLLDAAGDAIDLTGATVTWTLNDTRGFSNVLTRTTGGSGVVVTNEDAGLCTITVTPELSVGIAAGTYRDECRVYAPGGNVTVEWQGYIVVKSGNR